MNRLKLRLNQILDGGDQTTDVIANVYALDKKASSDSHARKLRNIIIPAGNFPDISYPWHQVDLNDGRYLVEVVLPSGDDVSKQIELSNDEERQLELEAPHSPHEWLSWQVFQNSRLASELASGEAQAKFRSSFTEPLRTCLVSLPRVSEDGSTRPDRMPAWRLFRDLVLSPRNRTGILLEGQIPDIEVLPVTSMASDENVSVMHFSSTGPVSSPGQDLSGAGYVNYQSEDLVRYFVTVHEREAVREIVSLPLPWTLPYGGPETVADLMLLKRDRSMAEEGAGFLTRTLIRDTGMAGIFGYLMSGDLPGAAALVKKSKGVLIDKFENPLAAAAGAYVLLSMPSETDQSNAPSWHRWVKNLMTYFPWLPDGAIQRGWLMLRANELKEAEEAFKTAFARGLPFYSIGVRWLLDGLSILISHEKSEGRAPAPELKDAADTVRAVARHTNMAEPFTSVRLGVLKGGES